MSKALARRILRLETILKPKPGLSPADETWINEHCGEDAPFLASVVRSCLSGEFAKGLFGIPRKGQV